MYLLNFYPIFPQKYSKSYTKILRSFGPVIVAHYLLLQGISDSKQKKWK